MNIYRETIPMKKHAALGLGAQSRYRQTSNYPSPLYKFEIVLSNYLRNRVSFAAIAVFIPARAPSSCRPAGYLCCIPYDRRLLL